MFLKEDPEQIQDFIHNLDEMLSSAYREGRAAEKESISQSFNQFLNKLR
jgi:hypothetical protein